MFSLEVKIIALIKPSGLVALPPPKHITALCVQGEVAARLSAYPRSRWLGASPCDGAERLRVMCQWHLRVVDACCKFVFTSMTMAASSHEWCAVRCLQAIASFMLSAPAVAHQQVFIAHLLCKVELPPSLVLGKVGVTT